MPLAIQAHHSWCMIGRLSHPLRPDHFVFAGMSMFSTRNGLYERARQRFKIQDGIKLFSYPFYKQRRMDVQVRLSWVD